MSKAQKHRLERCTSNARGLGRQMHVPGTEYCPHHVTSAPHERVVDLFLWSLEEVTQQEIEIVALCTEPGVGGISSTAPPPAPAPASAPPVLGHHDLSAKGSGMPPPLLIPFSLLCLLSASLPPLLLHHLCPTLSQCRVAFPSWQRHRPIQPSMPHYLANVLVDR